MPKWLVDGWSDAFGSFRGRDQSKAGRSITRGTWGTALCLSLLVFALCQVGEITPWVGAPIGVITGFLVTGFIVAGGSAKGRRIAASGEAWEAILEDVVVTDVDVQDDVLDIHVKVPLTRYRTLDADGNSIYETVNQETEEILLSIPLDVTDVLLAQEARERGERGSIRIYRVRTHEGEEGSGMTTFTFPTWHSTHPVGIG